MKISEKFFTITAALATLIATSVLMNPIKNALLKNEHSIESQSLKASIDKGFLFGMLGGYRSLISDFVWIKAYIDWEKKDIAGCLSAIELATTIDPYMITFWTQGSAIIAFDTPHWIVEKMPKERQNENVLNMYKRRQGGIALKLINKALAMFPRDPELLRQKGQIAIAMGNFKLAEECFAKLSTLPDPTVYARRIYASILVKNGNPQKAVEVLKSVLAETEPDSPIKAILEDQISEVELRIKNEDAR